MTITASHQQSLHKAVDLRLQWLFVAFLLMLNLPNFYWLDYFDTPNLNLIEYVERLLFSVLLSACFLALFARPWVAWLMAWLLCLWWQPLAWAVRLFSGTPITPTLVGTAISTSPAEVRNLVTAVPGVWFVLFALWNLACLILLYGLRRHDRGRWKMQFRGKVLFFSLAMLALPHLVLHLRVPANEASVATTDSRGARGGYEPGHPFLAFQEAERRVGKFTRLAEAFPYELPWAVAQYFQGRRVIDAMRANLRDPLPEYTLAEGDAGIDVVVLVIGESSTRNAWHLFNGDAPMTTPRLEARATRGEHIFGFGRTLTQTSATRQAVPSILTNQPLVWTDGEPNPDATRSIVSVAAQAGFATAWFSNQASVGRHDGIIATYAEEASTVAFLNPASFSDRGTLDEVLLPAVQRYLEEHRKSFIVLHTMGSHFNYRYRYPPGFGPFPAAESARDDYFNSIAYTDHVLDQLIDMLSEGDRRAALVYVADHGEAVPGGACKSDAATRTTRDTYEVPALIWLSEAYALSHPEVPLLLRAHEDHPYTVSALPQTLLDLIRGSTAGALPDVRIQSFLRPSRRSGEGGMEMVHEWTDKFERAVVKNPCFILLR